MLNFLKEQFAGWKLKKILKENTRPDEKFLSTTRNEFVNLARQRGSMLGHVGRSRTWRYATISVVAILAMTSGFAVFADVSDVSVNHPLYNLKRISEQVRLNLSSPEQRVELHKVFAQRRLQEVAELRQEEKANPSFSPVPARLSVPGVRASISYRREKNVSQEKRINVLNQDIQHEAEHGLDQAQDPQVKVEVRAKFCKGILDVIGRQDSSDQPSVDVIARIKNRCAAIPAPRPQSLQPSGN